MRDIRVDRIDALSRLYGLLIPYVVVVSSNPCSGDHSVELMGAFSFVTFFRVFYALIMTRNCISSWNVVCLLLCPLVFNYILLYLVLCPFLFILTFNSEKFYTKARPPSSQGEILGSFVERRRSFSLLVLLYFISRDVHCSCKCRFPML